MCNASLKEKMPEIKFYFILSKYLSYIPSFWLAGKNSCLSLFREKSFPFREGVPCKVALQKQQMDRYMTDI